MTAIPLLGRLQHRLHLHHHAEPSRIDLLFMPPWFLLPSLASTALLAWSIWPSPDRVASFLAGILAATLHYEWSHYVAHVPYRPRTRWGRRLKRRHLRHHFVDERTWFGVTHSLADLALGTHDRAEPIPRSATLQTLRRR